MQFPPRGLSAWAPTVCVRAGLAFELCPPHSQDIHTECNMFGAVDVCLFVAHAATTQDIDVRARVSCARSASARTGARRMGVRPSVRKLPFFSLSRRQDLCYVCETWPLAVCWGSVRVGRRRLSNRLVRRPALRVFVWVGHRRGFQAVRCSFEASSTVLLEFRLTQVLFTERVQ